MIKDCTERKILLIKLKSLEKIEREEDSKEEVDTTADLVKEVKDLTEVIEVDMATEAMETDKAQEEEVIILTKETIESAVIVAAEVEVMKKDKEIEAKVVADDNFIE